ncbi:hypothetical protein [Paractinoplanes atraurantiacus]|uniref:Uncharacterized protein n=1 Tax=Paractinoplanes atraurantiacus TaxID=1036182 RepID=A0A285IYU3_9ACTN|nr:hypothetical protein [Actinoplanes atraurantiacus]SNY53219.1 hypothetical protein SAMN05421748_113214 [Actinoplanes atraurantiacus]
MRVIPFGALSGLPVDRVVCGDSLGRSLLTAVARDHGETAGRIPLLGRLGQLPPERRRDELAREAHAEAVPHYAAAAIDAEAVAEWVTGHYRDATYPAVLLGSPHGAAAHLAVALGAAWLPTSFTTALTWPGGDAGDWPGALEWGASLAERILERNPGVSVRQVHDPLRGGPPCGSTVRLYLRWHSMPEAYETFLRERIADDGASLLLRDLRTWPARSLTSRHSFQLGSPVGGWQPDDYTIGNPAFRVVLDDLGVDRWPMPSQAPPRYAERSGEPAFGMDLNRIAVETGRPSHRVLYAQPETLSACVADLLRETSTRERCAVACGRLLDPWQTRANGLVPYWCESAARPAVEAAEWWLAGSPAFDEVTVLPEAPGHDSDQVATLAHWRSLTSFGRERGRIDQLAASRYPMLPLAPGHASRVLASAGEARPASPPISLPYAVSRLQKAGTPLGLLVS